jgi:hypothetical protein
MKMMNADMTFALPVWIGLSAGATLAPCAHVAA